ncbi:hypothetical protein ETAE_0033 [Edwardsiella piscicida]|uniref:Uncharacterized protein n=1 Tax=Edwardsiella piscicida TaxID=1263550 RepID=A0AAU8PB81_EDWPI|nr:hypothetical protein ETAE_0033 [Edwardsiella tarda EIB202]
MSELKCMYTYHIACDVHFDLNRKININHMVTKLIDMLVW